jgi:hypothetical protein
MLLEISVYFVLVSQFDLTVELLTSEFPFGTSNQRKASFFRVGQLT